LEGRVLFFKEKKHCDAVFDLIIADMTMPNLTGDKLSVELMSIRPDIPIIICTGYSNTIRSIMSPNRKKTARSVRIGLFQLSLFQCSARRQANRSVFQRFS
jgi:CheY-like chemotaxis protein